MEECSIRRKCNSLEKHLERGSPNEAALEHRRQNGQFIVEGLSETSSVVQVQWECFIAKDSAIERDRICEIRHLPRFVPHLRDKTDMGVPSLLQFSIGTTQLKPLLKLTNRAIIKTALTVI